MHPCKLLTQWLPLTTIPIESTIATRLASLAVPAVVSLRADGPEVPTAVSYGFIPRGGVGNLSAGDAPRS